ncbi:MAG: asparagine synthase (glutamine-hydrolyzing) [Bacteroidota bacterium]
MCGISGFIDFKKASDLNILSLMNETLLHRGPDSSGLELMSSENATIGLGHRRLSIIDLSSSGKQPMQFKNHWIAYNGEVYNYLEIRQTLIALGHSFRGNSDTEVVLHAFEQWGKDCINKFIGMFAFVIINTLTQEVICVRDRAGVKPFFYYYEDNLFLFSSELKAFHKHPRFKKVLNRNSVAAFMQYGNIPTPHCVFQNCYKLKPGCYLEFSLNKPDNTLSDSLVQQKYYWNVYDAYNKPKLDIDFNSAKQQTKDLLTSACNYRMVADVPVGVFLSGGYDSTAVAAILQNGRIEKLKTFTISVPDIGLDEAEYAKQTSKILGTDHTEIVCSQKDALNLIQDLPFYYDEPFGDSSAIPTTLVSLMARKQVTVALSADAGDEVFGGYNRYDYLMRYGQKLRSIPGFARKGIASIMDAVPANKIPFLKNKYNFPNRYEKLKSLLKEPSSEQMMLSLSEQFTDKQLAEFLNFTPEKLGTAYNSKELVNAGSSPLSYMMAIDYQTYLVDDILQKVDRATMSASLEAREPFLDHRVIEYAAQLPDDFKYRNGIKKYILREIVHDFIPKEKMARPKMGFAIPLASWMQNELKDMIEEYINEKDIQGQGLFNWEAVNRLKENFFSGKTEYDFKLWYLLMFQMWYERWMK